MSSDWELALLLLVCVSFVLIAITLSVFYVTVATLARDVDRAYMQINNVFHSLRIKAEQHMNENQEADRLAKNIDGGRNMK
jgi:hypothetical protein